MTAAIPFWDDITATWDKVRLGDTTLPGICSVGGSVKRDVEVKKSKGSDGATIKDNGYRPAPVSITWRIYTEEQWRQAQAFLPQIHPRDKGGERRPVAIGHPAPNFLGVDVVYVKEITFPELTGEKELSIRISAVEWVEKPKTPKAGGYAGSGQGNLDDAVAEDDQELIDALLDEAERQAWEVEQEQEQKKTWIEEEFEEDDDPEIFDPFADNAEDGADYDDEFSETT
jgi:hypothetical protein